MMLSKFVCLAALFLLLPARTVTAQDDKPRDLNRYVTGERFEMNWGVSPEGIDKLKLRARDFLWQQWKQKRLAYFLVADCLIYPEGCNDSIEYKIYVEPDEKGRWIVVIESERVESAWMTGKDKEQRTPLNSSVYSEVKKLEARRTSKCWPLFSEHGFEPPQNVYRLLLTNAAPGKDDVRRACAEF